MARTRFLMSTLRRYASFQRDDCPYCGTSPTKRLASKKVIVQLRRCGRCGLMFRFPKDDAATNESFYQEAYDEGATSELPSEAELGRLLATRFRGHEKDFSEKIRLLGRVHPGGRLLDFGCSWGYGAWQFRQAAYEVHGFEISRPRARFAQDRLGIPTTSSTSALDAFAPGTFQLIFANHVLEHLPDLKDVFPRLHRLLAPGGVLAVFVPNCTGIERAEVFARKRSWAIGEKHTIAFDDAFFNRNLPPHGFDVRCFAGSWPQESASPFDLPSRPVDAEGVELMVLARKEVTGP